MTHSEADRIEKLEKRLETLETKLQTLIDLLNQAKGAKWAILVVIGLGGYLSGFGSQWLHKFLP